MQVEECGGKCRFGRNRGALPCLQGRGEQGDMVLRRHTFICALYRAGSAQDPDYYLILLKYWTIERCTRKGDMTEVSLLTTALQARQRSTVPTEIAATGASRPQLP